MGPALGSVGDSSFPYAGWGDCRVNDVVLAEGETLGAAEVGLLATVGAAKVQVGHPPAIMEATVLPPVADREFRLGCQACDGAAAATVPLNSP